MNVQALRLPFVLLLLVACGPPEEDYLAAARAELARGCCVANDDGRCDKCALLDGAKVVSSRVEDCCANSGKHVILQTAGPNGSAECTFQLMAYGRTVKPNGSGCRPMK